MILPKLSTKTIFRKTTALLVALSFAFSNVVFADITKNTAPNEISKQIEVVSDPAKIVVPRDYGLVKSIFTGKDKRLIIHIQDAHCNFEAQSNIAKILENLIKNYGLTLVSVEGADGFIDTSWFKAFPDEEVRKEVAAYFMKKGEITGPEFLSITTDYPIRLFGAETRSYYIENLNAFTSSYPLKEDTEKYFNQIKTVLNKLKNYIYSDELKAIDAKIHDYESKKLQFTDYVKFLQGLADGHKINLRQYENLFKLISVLIYEKRIDFNVVDKERSILIDELTKKLTKEALTELVNNSLSFKTGKISSAEYYDYLKKLAAHHGFELSKDYPNLFNYIIYNSVYSRIENEKLFKDMKNLEIAVKEKLFANDDQRSLERLYRHIEILLGLANIKLLNGDFDYYKSHKEEFAHEIFAGFIKKMIAQYGFAFELDSPSDAIKESMSKLEDFYAIAVKRDKALVDNTLQAMKNESIQAAVLVTGGFHSEGITKMLENDGISYMVVCPNITKDVETPYIKILTNQRTPLEEILADTGVAAEPKSAKQGLLAPYLITAARIKAVDRLIDERAQDVLAAWAEKSIKPWLLKARQNALQKKLPFNAAIAAIMFARDVDNEAAEFKKRRAAKGETLSPREIKTLDKNVKTVKDLAPRVIEKLFNEQAAQAAGNLIGNIKTLENPLPPQKPADIIMQGVEAEHKGEGRGDMGKVDIAVGLDRAVHGDENAYKTIVDMPREKLIEYLETFVKDGLDKLPEGLFGFGKGYDIRGNAWPITGGIVDITPLNVYIIGKLLGTYYAEAGDKMLVTGDIRIHTPILKFMLALGASSVGVNAEYAPDFLTTGAHNLLSTDNEGNYKVMVQVSGSHGVPQKTGLKIKTFLGKKDVSGRMILEPLYTERLEGLYWKDKAKGVRQTDLRKEAEAGSVKEIAGLAEDVVNTLDKTLPPTEKDEIVVIDPRAGAAGPIILKLLKKRGFFVIDMDYIDKKELISEIGAIWNAPGRENGKFRAAVMLNAKPDGNMGRGIWDPSNPEALKDAIELVNLINSNLLEGMPKAFGAVFDGDADRITGILEDGTGVPAFEMTLPYYQRFLLDESNQEVMVRLSKSGFGPVRVVCDVRANSKLLALIDKVNGDLRNKANIYDKNIVEGWFITTGYPPQLGFMNNRIAQLDEFVNSNPGLKEDADFMEKFTHLKRTYFTAEASGHNFFHVSERYPDRVLDDAIAGFFALMNIRETLTPAEVPVMKKELLLTDVFGNFPIAYSSREIRIPVPNPVKIAITTEIGAWMKERYGRELKPYMPAVKEDDYLIQPKDDGYVTVSGFKIQLQDGRTALVRWSNTGEEFTTIFEGRDLASLISITSEITERLRMEVKRGVHVSNLDNEIARLKELRKYESGAQEKQDAPVIGQKLHTPLSSTIPVMAARFLQGGYNQSGYGVPVGAAIDGSFPTGREGSQGYYVDKTNRGISGRSLFVSDVEKMKNLFAARDQEGKPIRYVIKIGIGGQHTPFQGIAIGIQVIDMKKGIIVGEYELGKDYESELNRVLKTLDGDVGWDQIAVIPSSKSGSTDETMMIFAEVFYTMMENMARSAGFNKTNAANFTQTVFEAMHKINFPGGKELKGADIFKNMTLAFVAGEMKEKGFSEDQVRKIFAMTLRNMIFETTDRPESSRLAAFLASPLVQSLKENDKPVVISMFDNVGGRWTADLHMMLFLAYNNLNADEYWKIRYKGIKETRSETHAGYKLGEKIVNEGITDIALVLPEEFFWFGKAIEQNFNESIWQDGFANLIAIKEDNWKYQEKHYAHNPSKLVINLSSPYIPLKPFNLFNLGPVDLKKLPDDQARVNKLGELFTTFYGMTHTVGNRLIVRALAAKGYTAADVDLNDLDNPATKIVQQNLYLRQPYVELGKGLLEEKLKALQAKGSEAVKAEFEKNISLAAQKRLESKVPSIPSGNISNVKELTDVIYAAVKSAEETNRKFVPFIYLEGEKLYELREHLVKLGIEWVLQGTGDQHISYQQVLAQPQKYLPFIVSFLPKDTEKSLLGRPAIGFAKGYLNNVRPHMVRDLFAEMSYRALIDPRKNEAGEEVKGAAGIFLRMIDIEADRALLTQSFDKAFAPTEDAVPEVAVSDSFDHTPEAIWQSSAIGESVRHMAVEKFKYDGKMHLIFVKRAIPQIQLSTTTAVNLANICEEYYNAMEGYTAHIVDSYEKAVELLAKNSGWNKTNTIVGLVDEDDLEAMGSNLTANKMRDKTKLLAMEKFSEDQFVPIKGFFDLMSVMVRINKPLDTTNDSELIDGLRKLLNEIGVRDVNSLVDALSTGAYFEDPIKFATNFILRLLPPAKPRDTKELKALYDAAKKVVESL